MVSMTVVVLPSHGQRCVEVETPFPSPARSLGINLIALDPALVLSVSDVERERAQRDTAL